MIIFLCILFAVLTIVFFRLYDGYNDLEDKKHQIKYKIKEGHHVYMSGF